MTSGGYSSYFLLRATPASCLLALGVGVFGRVYVLLFLTGMAFALIARRMGVWSYKVAIGVALVAGLVLGWSTMVQTADSGHPEHMWYLSVLVVGFIGACLSRPTAAGLAITLFAIEGCWR